MLIRFFARWIALPMTIGALSLAQASSTRYAASAIEGRVTEVGADVPLPGVIVVVSWELLDSALLPIGQAMAMETVTDQAGHFSFAAWGPKRLPPKARLDPKAPQLLFFKEGYQYRWLTNDKKAGAGGGAPLSSVWNGKTVELRRLPADAVAQIGARVVSKHSLSLSNLSIALDWAYRGKNCEWKQVPRMIAAVDRTKQAFERRGIRSDLKSIGDLPASAKCGSPRDFFNSYPP